MKEYRTKKGKPFEAIPMMMTGEDLEVTRSNEEEVDKSSIDQRNPELPCLFAR